MSDKAKKLEGFHVTGSIAGTAIVLATLNFIAVQYEYRPFAYCYGMKIVEALRLDAFWSLCVVVGIALCFYYIIAEERRNLFKTLAVLMVILMLPTWLDQGLRLGGHCYGESAIMDPETHERLVREQYSRTPVLMDGN